MEAAFVLPAMVLLLLVAVQLTQLQVALPWATRLLNLPDPS